MTRWPSQKKGKILRRFHTLVPRSFAVPTAVLGTIALSLTATPAGAVEAERAHNRLLAPLPATKVPPQSVPASTPPSSHTVEPGDTVSAIAAQHGLKTADVLAWNGLGWSSIIRPGQVLALTGASTDPTVAPPAPAPAAATIATHTVTGGETLWGIAQAGGIGLTALLDANGLTRDSIIYPGQELSIPSAAAPASPTMTPAAVVAIETAPVTPLDAEQIANAQIIIDVGRGLGVPDRGIAIALATAMVESWIRNLDWGDRDSLGLFQQRPSQGWGTEGEVRDARRAAAAFFGGTHDPNGSRTQGLLDVPGWQEMEFGAAAQTVQRSAYPERYAPWEEQARTWVAAYG